MYYIRSRMLVANDKELFLSVKRDDVKAYETIFRSFYQPLCNYAYSFLNDQDECEEVVQQVFLTIWDKRHSIVISSSLQAYLYRAVKNECLNKIQHGKVRTMYRKEVESLGEAGIDSTSEKVISAELELKIKDAIDTLPAQCQLIFQLSRFENKKYQEIADELGISVKTVENQIGKALRIMREKLVEFLPLLILYLFHFNR
jgi:RNA polymerase sigma-70 factor (ECF subfamily)